MGTSSDTLKHFCGVAGIYSPVPANVPQHLFFPLFSLQHRGQESAGIAYRKDGGIIAYKDLGMVSTVLSRYLTGHRETNVGIGHVRYSTHGGNKLENAQPLVVRCNKGEIAIAHNGNISNALQLKHRLVEEGAIFQTSSDTELILHMLSRSRRDSFDTALEDVLEALEGAYTMVLIHDERLFAVRDPNGFRPLFVGYHDGMAVVASESCALDVLGCDNQRELDPGDIIVFGPEGEQHRRIRSTGRRKAQCVFELIYFARPDSRVFGTGVYTARKKMGRALAEVDALAGRTGDIVVPVPDSGTTAAIGYSEASGIPFDFGLTRNHYAGRSFIMPTTAERELAVRMKLHPVMDVISGKSVMLIDDSLVRGTTARSLVKLLKRAGAKEVHLRLCSPELRWPCFFGIDIPTRDELISNKKSPEEIAEYIGADSVCFLDIAHLKGVLSEPNDFCYACFSGSYPLAVPLTEHERKRQPRDVDLTSMEH
ncbi:MAG: amidophosphoribosyltransferase [Spirochaetota bacterium]